MSCDTRFKGLQAKITLAKRTLLTAKPYLVMIGAIAQCVPGREDIVLQHDPELEDAKWVNLQEVRRALEIGTSGLGEDPSPVYMNGDLRLPPKTAIANQLLSAVTENLLDGVNGGSKI